MPRPSVRVSCLPALVLCLGSAAGCGDSGDTGSGGDTTTTVGSTTSGAGGDATTSTTTASTTTGTGGAAGTGGAGGAGTGGAPGTGGGAAAGDGVLYWGDFETDALAQVATASFPGPTLSTLALAGLTGGDEVASVAVSPDGTKIAVAGRDTATSSAVINVYPADGSGTPLTLATGAAVNREIRSLAYSHDGAWIGFLNDNELAGSFAAWVVKSDGTAAAKRVSDVPTLSTLDVTSFAWRPDLGQTPRHIVYVADPTTNNDYGLHAVEITTAIPSPIVLVSDSDLVAGADVQDLIAFDASGRIYFKSDLEVDQLFRLYRVDIDGNNRVQVPGTALTNGSGDASIGTFGMNASGTKLAFSSDSPNLRIYDVHVLDLGGNTATQVSAVGAIAPRIGQFSGPDLGELIQWSPDGTHLAVAADWITVQPGLNYSFGAWILPTSGVGGVRVYSTATSASQDVVGVLFSADSGRLYVRGDLRTDAEFEVYSTTDFVTAAQDPSATIIEAVPAAGSVNGMVLAP